MIGGVALGLHFGVIGKGHASVGGPSTAGQPFGLLLALTLAS